MTTDLILLDAGDDGDVAVGGARPLAIVEGGDPPSEWLMFGPGITETVKGPLLFDEEAATAVMAFYESRGRKRIAGDWEHDSMVPANERPPNYRGSPASHWFEPSVRPGPELWAANVKWTPDAFTQIQKGEYAHTSPVVKFQKSTGRIVAVLSCALTNDPATIGQPQLVAATAKTTVSLSEKSMPMYKMNADTAAKLKALVDGEHKDEAEMAGKMKACLAESFPDHFGEKHKEPDGDEEGAKKMAEIAGGEEESGKKLDNAYDGDKGSAPWQAVNAAIHTKTGNTHDEGGRKSSATTDEEKRAMSAKRVTGLNALWNLRRDVMALTGKVRVTEQVAALTAMKHASEDVAALTAKIKTRDGSAFEAVVDQGKKAMKFSPADLASGSQTNRGKYIAAQRGKGEDGVMALTAYLAEIKPHATSTDSTEREPETANLDTVRLSAAEVESCEKNGIDKVEYLKNKKARHAAGDAPRFDASR